jgi:hypothetical protein
MIRTNGKGSDSHNSHGIGEVMAQPPQWQKLNGAVDGGRQSDYHGSWDTKHKKRGNGK